MLLQAVLKLSAATSATASVGVKKFFIVQDFLRGIKFNVLSGKTKYVPQNYHGFVKVVSVKKSVSLKVRKKARRASFCV